MDSEELVLKIENVSKQYRLGLVGTGTISHDLKRWWYLIRGKEDPYEKVGIENDRTKEGGEYVWALDDVSFEVKKGSVVGIIGQNGAGKSTLLKILSQITEPTKGGVKIKGRLAALLEVGTGFHPELTGKENIFLNGAILGMTKKEVSSKLDDIVAFSGIAKYLDTPVKRYSSGMIVRLGFAIAAHLEPEILIVDEVLAVGDAEFQDKCLGKMKDVAAEGRTVLFVSHNMQAIKRLCDEVVVLKNGRVDFIGGTGEGINHYLASVKTSNVFYENKEPELDKQAVTRKVTLTNDKNEVVNIFDYTEDINVTILFEIKEELEGVAIEFAVANPSDTIVIGASIQYKIQDFVERTLDKGVYKATVKIPGKLLNSGDYLFRLFLTNKKERKTYERLDLIWFKISEKGLYPDAQKRPAILIPDLNWNVERTS